MRLMSKFSKDQIREDLTAIDTVRDCQERRLESDRCGIYLINLDRPADRLKAVT